MVTSSVNSLPHGSRVYAENGPCSCQYCESKRFAVQRLIDSFAKLSSRWLEVIIHSLGESAAMPMWGTFFIPDDPIDVRKIEDLLCEIDREGEDIVSLTNAGWEQVADTGILARTVDEKLILGIHGVGYAFHSHHWEPLYDALGYQWHSSPNER